MQFNFFETQDLTNKTTFHALHHITNIHKRIKYKSKYGNGTDTSFHRMYF